ncbi:MAG TPA: hypothetical protein ENH29_08975 [Bacteroidetes bacterium]|nr:hypothetical protein [Bacteroidota bacterium]
MQISFTPEFQERLQREFEQEPQKFPVQCDPADPFHLELALDQDMLLSFSGRLSGEYEDRHKKLPDGRTVDEWGIIRKDIYYETRFGNGSYQEMVGFPLADDKAIFTYHPPDPNNPALYLEAEKLIREYRDEYWIVGCAVTTIFETAWALRGYENILMDFLINPDFVGELLNIPFEYNLTVAKNLTRMGVDMIWLGDDVGAQNEMLISPELWRRFLKPKMAEIISAVKEIDPRVKVAYHSDGYIIPIISDLIEIGLDILNPIQPQSMDPALIKRKFGEHLCFWGSIDEQQTLPFGSSTEVRAEIHLLLKTIGKDGGLILAPTHNVQLDTPMENFWMMVDTIRNIPYSAVYLVFD